MSETVNVNFNDLKIMGSDALDFFAEELSNRNAIEVTLNNGAKKSFSDIRSWDSFLLEVGLRKPPEKKNIRI